MKLIGIVLLLFPFYLFAQPGGNLSIHYTFSLYQIDSLNKEEKIYSAPVNLFFTDSAFYLTRNNERKVLDFSKEKIYYLDINSFTYDETPLFAEIDYKHNQLSNTLALKKFYSKNDIKNYISSIFQLECFWGIHINRDSLINSIKIFKSDSSNYLTFENDTITRLTTKKIKKNYGHLIRKFFYYECHIHPLFINQNNFDFSLFTNLSFHYFRNGKAFRAEYLLKDFNENASTKELNNNEFTFKHEFNDALFSNLNKIYGFLHNSSIKKTTKENCLNDYNIALKKKKYADALLTLTECNLTENDDYSVQIKELERIAEDNKKLKLLLESIKGSKDRTETLAKIEHLKTIKKSKRITKSYMIEAFLANHYDKLDEAEKVRSSYLKLISRNPYITGVYYDLGNFLWKQNNYGFAWKCYEIAIKINQTHPLTRKILSKKIFYKYNYPDYF